MESNVHAVAVIVGIVGVLVVLAGGREVANYEDGDAWWGVLGVVVGIAMIIGAMMLAGRFG